MVYDLNFTRIDRRDPAAGRRDKDRPPLPGGGPARSRRERASYGARSTTDHAVSGRDRSAMIAAKGINRCDHRDTARSCRSTLAPLPTTLKVGQET